MLLLQINMLFTNIDDSNDALSCGTNALLGLFLFPLKSFQLSSVGLSVLNW
jgi:hypothetical protein